MLTPATPAQMLSGIMLMLQHACSMQLARRKARACFFETWQKAGLHQSYVYFTCHGERPRITDITSLWQLQRTIILNRCICCAGQSLLWQCCHGFCACRMTHEGIQNSNAQHEPCQPNTAPLPHHAGGWQPVDGSDAISEQW